MGVSLSPAGWPRLEGELVRPAPTTSFITAGPESPWQTHRPPPSPSRLCVRPCRVALADLTTSATLAASKGGPSRTGGGVSMTKRSTSCSAPVREALVDRSAAGHPRPVRERGPAVRVGPILSAPPQLARPSLGGRGGLRQSSAALRTLAVAGATWASPLPRVAGDDVGPAPADRPKPRRWTAPDASGPWWYDDKSERSQIN